MKASKYLIAAITALLFGSASMFAADSSTGTTSGGSASGTSSSSTSTTSTSGGTTTGGMGGMGSSSPETHGKANPHTVNPNASATAQAVQAILQKFDAARDQEMANRQALIDQLKAATTDAQRQQILAELKTELQTEKAQRAQVGKEIRDELKTLHEQKKGGG